jgi:prepilin-type N-terminal cleavage/methylation domain-containing protein
MGVRSLRAGFTIIELMITLAVLGVLLALGMPSISSWLQNTQIRTAAEGMVSGLQLARAEALRRNANVRCRTPPRRATRILPTPSRRRSCRRRPPRRVPATR